MLFSLIVKLKNDKKPLYSIRGDTNNYQPPEDPPPPNPPPPKPPPNPPPKPPPEEPPPPNPTPPKPLPALLKIIASKIENPLLRFPPPFPPRLFLLDMMINRIIKNLGAKLALCSEL